MATQSVNYWKWGVFAAIGAALFLWGRSCGIGSVLKQTHIDTVVKFVKGDIVYTPEFVGVSNTIYEPKIVTVHDTLETFETRVDTVLAVQLYPDYMDVKFYSDTQRLARGTVIIQDTVTQNRIQRRRLQTFGTDTTITKTVVLKPPRNMVGYFTTSLLGNNFNPLDGIGGGFALKTKNDMIYGAEAKFIRGKRVLYEARLSLPIRLSKEK